MGGGWRRVKKKLMQNEQLIFKIMLKKSNNEQPRSLLAFLYYRLARELGYPILTFIDTLFLETGFELLLSSRSAAKLVIMYKVHNNKVSEYLKEAISSNIYMSTYMYNLLNRDNYKNADFQVYKKVIYTRCCIRVDFS